MKPVAIVLIVLGCIGILWGGLTWTRSEKVIDIGPVEVRRDKQSSIPIPPLFGLVAVAAGVVILSRNR